MSNTPRIDEAIENGWLVSEARDIERELSVITSERDKYLGVLKSISEMDSVDLGAGLSVRGMVRDVLPPQSSR